MELPLMAWSPPTAVLPDSALAVDMAIGAWFGLALLVSLLPLLWIAVWPRDLSTRIPRLTHPQPRPIGRRHAIPGRP